MQHNLPTHAEIVIVGGGIAGSSLAYHLTKLGRTDVVLLERGRLTCGTTWHAAGLIMQLRSTHAMTELARVNVELYSSLEAETGHATGFKQNGTLGVCRTRDRMHETMRTATIARSFGIEAEMIGPAEAKALYPAIDERLLEGAIFIPKDGQTNPVDTALSLVAGARMRGARIFEDTPVSRLGAVGFGRLSPGDGARADPVRDPGARLRALDPRPRGPARRPRAALSVRAHVVVTEPLQFVEPGLPVLRDTDGHNYVQGGCGQAPGRPFEPGGKPLPMEKLPANPQFVELPEDWDQFTLPMTRARR